MNPQDYEKNEGDSVFSRRQAPEIAHASGTTKRTEARPNYDQVRDTTPRGNYDERPNQNAWQIIIPKNGATRNKIKWTTDQYEQPTYSNRLKPQQAIHAAKRR